VSIDQNPHLVLSLVSLPNPTKKKKINWSNQNQCFHLQGFFPAAQGNIGPCKEFTRK
jgi:hypothetical protein